MSIPGLYFILFYSKNILSNLLYINFLKPSLECAEKAWAWPEHDLIDRKCILFLWKLHLHFHQCINYYLKYQKQNRWKTCRAMFENDSILISNFATALVTFHLWLLLLLLLISSSEIISVWFRLCLTDTICLSETTGEEGHARGIKSWYLSSLDEIKSM